MLIFETKCGKMEGSCDVYRDKNEFGGRMTNKMMTAHLRAGFLPQWRTEEEDACTE